MLALEGMHYDMDEEDEDDNSFVADEVIYIHIYVCVLGNIHTYMYGMYYGMDMDEEDERRQLFCSR
jgi:hypothetical protein